MNSKTVSALVVAGAILGIWGDILFQGSAGWGINALGWTLAVAAAIALLRRRAGLVENPTGKGLAISAIVIAAGAGWRDSTMLHALDVLTTAVLLALWAADGVAGALSRSYLWGYILSCAASIGHTFVGCGLFLGSDVDWASVRSRPGGSSAKPVLRGLILSVPLLLVFGNLFANADPVYAHFVQELFSWDITDCVVRLFWILAIAWGSIGFVRYALNGLASDGGDFPVRGGFLGKIEAVTILGSLDLLFLSFVAVQFRYLFGGAALVHATIGLTYAEYARAGFFELSTASGLLLPVLLLLNWMVDKSDGAAVKSFRRLGAIQIGLLFVVMASAMQRMHIYQMAFGLTEMRVYTVAFMGWLALVFLWLGVSVLRGSADRFTFGAVSAAVAVLAVLHLVDPDSLIVSNNARLALRTGHFDGCYAQTLSADAVPALVDTLPHVDPPTQAIIARAILAWTPPVNIDWRDWNVGKGLAWNAAEQNTPGLRDMLKNLPSNACEDESD